MSKKAVKFYWQFVTPGSRGQKWDLKHPLCAYGPCGSVEACLDAASKTRSSGNYVRNGKAQIYVGTALRSVLVDECVVTPIFADNVADEIIGVVDSRSLGALSVFRVSRPRANAELRAFLLPWCAKYLASADPVLDLSQAAKHSLELSPWVEAQTWLKKRPRSLQHLPESSELRKVLVKLHELCTYNSNK